MAVKDKRRRRGAAQQTPAVPDEAPPAPSENTPDLGAYKSLIESALAYSHGGLTYEDVVKGVREGRYQVWPLPHSVLLTEIAESSAGPTLHFVLGSGNMPEIAASIGVVEQWAREKGCTRAAFTGRKGWERTFMTRIGYEPVAVVFLKPSL